MQTNAELDTVKQRLAALEPQHADIVAAHKSEVDRADRTIQEVKLLATAVLCTKCTEHCTNCSAAALASQAD